MIENRAYLSSGSNAKTRKDILDIIEGAIKTVDPASCIKNYLKRKGSELRVGGSVYDLDSYKNIYVVGAGKAGGAMAQALEELLGDRITEGFVSTKYDTCTKTMTIRQWEANHPIPDENSLKAGEKILEIAKKAEKDDLLICLISGGGSALMESLYSDITLEDMKKTTGLLLKAGANIDEINAIRKHISRVKGGRLAEAAYPAKVLTLMLSDVVGDKLDVIASGPSVKDTTTFDDAYGILKKYDLLKSLPESVTSYMKRGVEGKVKDTPKDDRIFGDVHNLIVGSNALALEYCVREANKMGYDTLVLYQHMEGESREVARKHAELAKKIMSADEYARKPVMIISGGETTVTVKGNGKGGRNQEIVLSTVLEMKDKDGKYVIASIGTDGIDGVTEAAGAIADNETLERAKKLKLNADKHLRDNDSYNFFKPLEDLIVTGPTGTNVNDIMLMAII